MHKAPRLNRLIYLLFLSVFFLDYLALKLGLLNAKLAWFPDVLSMVAVVIVVLLAPRSRPAIGLKWLVFFGAFLVVLLIGIVSNTVSAGPLIVGLRSYLKFLPFFFLPIVFAFDERQVSRQLKLLLALALLQGPLGLAQKFIQFGATSSGDYVSGTLSSGGQLPILLASALAIATAFYLRQRIGVKTYIVLLAFLVAPLTLAESKASIGYIPLAFMIPMLYIGGVPGQKQFSGKTLGLLALFTATAFSFLVVYDHFAQYGHANLQGGLINFFVSGEATEYLNRGAVDQRRITKLGYADILALPLAKLADEPLRMMFGLGIGNVQTSAIGSLSGEYAREYGQYGLTESAIALFLWEIGLVGAAFYCLLMVMLFLDARRLSKDLGLYGVIGLGMCGVAAIAFVALFFRNMYLDSVNGYLFWYLAGLTVAARYRLGASPRTGRSDRP